MTGTHVERLRLPPNWCGPDGIGQGGVVAGRLASSLAGGLVEVRLHAPAPLDTDLEIRATTDSERMLADGDRLIATAKPIDEIEATPPPHVTVEAARRVTGTLREHNPYPRCLICGHERDDGLRVWPGVLPDGGVAAVFEVPAGFRDAAGALATPFVFGALDCTAGYEVTRPTRQHEQQGLSHDG